MNFIQISIDNTGENDALNLDELNALMVAPRIPKSFTVTAVIRRRLPLNF
ncbi:MAG: hypothetical protein LBS08_01505 [Candidatus Symbiothrix sp.]|nr:hypothetical protein [Candidatus Symbiothrix sp.]